ncbi:hypothetical protein [Planktothricoides raciborskii]|uniref:Uncharacterized protein n=2 Tax=Planktothricoides raciborskii TaxID=132608 RepID=A0AAU8JB06_9CYAN|nr:hypothetical protein [Planktothricoides raciborskii]MBD2545109.1 hypothetical protein [Planktothricoides raciborskii FACHB-1370]MBD2584235.1 hypothetical protein [Planktothricoides raciborskii FACHB-1261]
MTFEEMQKIIEGMLAVQRELQESQIELKQSQAEFRASQEAQKDVLNELIKKYGDLAEQSIRQRDILDRLIGYSLTNESDHLNLEEKLQALEARIKRIENKS